MFVLGATTNCLWVRLHDVHANVTEHAIPAISCDIIEDAEAVTRLILEGRSRRELVL